MSISQVVHQQLVSVIDSKLVLVLLF